MTESLQVMQYSILLRGTQLPTGLVLQKNAVVILEHLSEKWYRKFNITIISQVLPFLIAFVGVLIGLIKYTNQVDKENKERHEIHLQKYISAILTMPLIK